MRAFLDENGLRNLDPLTSQPPKQMDNSDFCEDGMDDDFGNDVPYVDHTDTVVDNEDLQAVWDVEAAADSPTLL